MPRSLSSNGPWSEYSTSTFQRSLRPMRSMPASTVVGGEAALGRDALAELGGDGAEALAKDDVHDALVRPVTELQRHLLGQDFDAADRLGRDAADLAEAGDALAVQQHDRRAAAGAAGLRRQRLDQLADRRRAVGAHVARVRASRSAGYCRAPSRAAPGPRRRSPRPPPRHPHRQLARPRAPRRRRRDSAARAASPARAAARARRRRATG